MFLVNGELAPLQLTRDYRNQSKEKVAKWEWKQVLPHCNLHSWVKEGSVVDSSILETFKLEYSEEEYNTHLSNPNWSKEETDYLFHLCSEYNLRFPIIMDRYDQPIQRSMEDIKARYYQVCKKLAAVKTAGYTFVESKEKLRKEHINKLLSRTPEQLLEEELLYHEIQMYQARRECWSRERDLLYKMVSHNKDATASLTEKSISLKRRKGALSRNKKDNLEGFQQNLIFRFDSKTRNANITYLSSLK
ncbi:DNA methyltransferase 1-associated protein 1 [Globomyces sp. JEL0801]|nr:DNA methyltransferase 1-associated protein 1 [Globomyces sp. JEL0801]